MRRRPRRYTLGVQIRIEHGTGVLSVKTRGGIFRLGLVNLYDLICCAFKFCVSLWCDWEWKHAALGSLRYGNSVPATNVSGDVPKTMENVQHFLELHEWRRSDFSSMICRIQIMWGCYEAHCDGNHIRSKSCDISSTAVQQVYFTNLMQFGLQVGEFHEWLNDESDYDLLTLFNGQTIGGSNDPYHLDHIWFLSFSFGQMSVNVHDWKYSQSIPSGLQRSKTTTTWKTVDVQIVKRSNESVRR